MIDSVEWARCAPWLEAALAYAHGTHTLDDVRAACEARTMQFWPGRACAFVTELVRYPQVTCLHIFLTGGDLGEIAARYPAVADWGRSQGATRVTAVARPGWARTFIRGHGFAVTGHHFEAAL